MSWYRVVNLLLEAEDVPEPFRPFALEKGAKRTGSPVLAEEGKQRELPAANEDGKMRELPVVKVRYEAAEKMKGDFEPITTVSGLRIGTDAGGWIYEDIATGCRMRADEAYSGAVLSENVKENKILWGFLLQLFLECRLIDEGVLTLHSCCVEHEGLAYAFSGPSGCGKSTRARRWAEGFGASFISGDRPAVDVKEGAAYGAPWDGKEQIFRNASVPFGAVFQVRRAPFTRLRRLSKTQIRDFLIGQLVVPMWDPDRALTAMILLSKLAERIPVYRLFCDQDLAAAGETVNILLRHQEKILEECSEMKLNEGFVLKSMAGEYVIMPTGVNIANFNGTVMLNEVSAFIVKQLERGPLGREDLIDLILAEYEADRETVAKDLDEFTDKMCGFGVISK